MDSGITTAVAAIAGSMVGSLGTLVTTWITQRYHDRRGLLATQIARREALYSDFISESARLFIDALGHNKVEPRKLIAMYALLGRIRISSSPQVLAAAEDVLKAIVGTYPKPNLTPEQISAGAMRSQDQLGQFSDICRSELAYVQEQF